MKLISKALLWSTGRAGDVVVRKADYDAKLAELASLKAKLGLLSPNPRTKGSIFYIAHFPYHHDRLYAENLQEFLSDLGLNTATILLDDPANGQRPQLEEALAGDAIAIIGFNSQLDRSYIGSQPFLDAAAESRVPAIQWILDHPSSRLAEFSNSSPANSRFVFSSRDAEAYFNRFGIPNALTTAVACVGPSRYSRARRLSFDDFSRRPIAGMVAMNLTRIGGTIADAWQRVKALDRRLREAVEQAIEASYSDVINPLDANFEKLLATSGIAVAAGDRNACLQMIEEIVQIRRRQKILEVAREFPILIQSDAASRVFHAGAKAAFKEDQDVAVTWARLKLTRANVCISNMHDMVHDRVLNGLNAGCLNIVEDSEANRRAFTHGKDALFFRYEDDSLRECLNVVCEDFEKSYEIAANGFARRDERAFRFGDFENIIRLANAPFPKKG
jgi:hypothetical protein